MHKFRVDLLRADHFGINLALIPDAHDSTARQEVIHHCQLRFVVQFAVIDRVVERTAHDIGHDLAERIDIAETSANVRLRHAVVDRRREDFRVRPQDVEALPLRRLSDAAWLALFVAVEFVDALGFLAPGFFLFVREFDFHEPARDDTTRRRACIFGAL